MNAHIRCLHCPKRAFPSMRRSHARTQKKFLKHLIALCKVAKGIFMKNEYVYLLKLSFNRLSMDPTNKVPNGKIMDLYETWVG